MAKRHLGYDLPYVKKAYRVLDIMVPERRKRSIKVVRNGSPTPNSNTREKDGKAGEEAVNTLVADPETPAADMKGTEESTAARPDITVELVTNAV